MLMPRDVNREITAGASSSQKGSDVQSRAFLLQDLKGGHFLSASCGTEREVYLLG